MKTEPDRKTIVEAQRIAIHHKEPAVIWTDADYGKERVCRLSYYEGEGSAFIEESDIMIIVDERGYRID